MQTNGLRVLLNHFEDKPTYVFKLSDSIDDIVVSNGCQTFRIDRMEDVFDEYDVSDEHAKLVYKAIESLKDDTPVTLDELFNICKMFNFFCTFDIINTLSNPYDSLNLYKMCTIGSITSIKYGHVLTITERILNAVDEFDYGNIYHLNELIDNIILVGDLRCLHILKTLSILYNTVFDQADHVKKRVKEYVDNLMFPVPSLRDYIVENLTGNALMGSILLTYKEGYAFESAISYLNYNLSECKLNTLPRELSDIIRNYKSGTIAFTIESI